MIAIDTSAAIDALISDVRRALWLGHLQHAARAALWAWAVIMTAGAILHALTGRPGPVTALVIGGAASLIALAAAAMRRPDVATAALHADRRLGGQSAYSTWLEERKARPESAAMRRLVEWSDAAVPSARDALARQRTSWQLLRPGAAATICTALAIAVVMLGSSRPAPAPASAGSTAPGPAAADAPMLDEKAFADTVASELAASDRPADAAAVRGNRESSTDGRGPAAVTPGETEAIDGEATASLRREAASDSAASGSGREAGSTRDDSAPGAGSRAAAGPMLVQRRAVSGSADDAQRLADDERVASYQDETLADSGPTPTAGADAAAARPPAARREVRLSPAEAAYVANWRKGSRAMDQEQ